MNLKDEIKKNPRHYCQLAGNIVQLIYGVFAVIWGFFRSLLTTESGEVLPEAIVGFWMILIGLVCIGFGIAALLNNYDSIGKIYRNKLFMSGVNIVVCIAAIILTTDAIQFIFFPLIIIGFNVAAFIFKNEKKPDVFETHKNPTNSASESK